MFNDEMEEEIEWDFSPRQILYDAYYFKSDNIRKLPVKLIVRCILMDPRKFHNGPLCLLANYMVHERLSKESIEKSRRIMWECGIPEIEIVVDILDKMGGFYHMKHEHRAFIGYEIGHVMDEYCGKIEEGMTTFIKK